MNPTYTKTDQLALLAFKAIRALQIDVPILKVEEAAGHIRLHLYGGRVVEYPTLTPPEDSGKDGPAPARPAQPRRKGKNK